MPSSDTNEESPPKTTIFDTEPSRGEHGSKNKDEDEKQKVRLIESDETDIRAPPQLLPSPGAVQVGPGHRQSGEASNDGSTKTTHFKTNKPKQRVARREWLAEQDGNAATSNFAGSYYSETPFGRPSDSKSRSSAAAVTPGAVSTNASSGYAANSRNNKPKQRVTRREWLAEKNGNPTRPPPTLPLESEDLQDEAPSNYQDEIPPIEATAAPDVEEMIEAARQQGRQEGRQERRTIQTEVVVAEPAPESTDGDIVENKHLYGSTFGAFVLIAAGIITAVVFLRPDNSTDPIVDEPNQVVSISSSPGKKQCFETREDIEIALINWAFATCTSFCLDRKKDVESLHGPIRDWCFDPNFSDMSNLFLDKTEFNEDISNWNVSSVTDMRSMFEGASAFNQDISNWNVTSVTDMRFMFDQASGFNQDLCAWGEHIPKSAMNTLMFRNTSCPSTATSDLTANPPGAFCHFCSSP